MPLITNKTRKYNVLVFIFTCQIITTLGWISIYPYGGQLSLFLWLAFFYFFTSEIKKHLLYGLVIILVLLYSHIPREYGPPNNQWILNLLIFGQLFYLNRETLVDIFKFFCDTLLSLCIASLFFNILYKLNIIIVLRELQIGPQIFRASWPFYVDRVNISKSQDSQFLFDERFHGPFFEPGTLGICLGMCLFLNNNRHRNLGLVFFGMITMSIAFLSCLFLSLIDKALLKQIKTKILILFISLLCVWPIFDNGSFFYQSTYGRIMGIGDKVLNTRLSFQEIDQIELFNRTFKQKPVDAFWGVGWDTPGSGGSYRAWLLGAGVFGTLIWLIFYISLIRKNIIYNNINLLTRFGFVFLFIYTFGNWLSPLMVLIFVEEQNKYNLLKTNKI